MSNVIRVAVVNRSRLGDADVESGVAALREQVRGDLAAAWGIDGDLFIWGKDSEERRGAWALVLADGPAPAEGAELPADHPAAGYGDVTSAGMPLARVHLGDVPAGQDWTHRASHELLEMLVSSLVSAPVYRQAGADGPQACFGIYAREICDPCAAYEDGYACRGRHVSDFVFPAWFDLGECRSGRGGELDERRRTGRPFQVLPGGWAHVYDLAAGRWTAVDDRGAVVAGAHVSGRLGRLRQSLGGLRHPRDGGVLYPP